MIEFGDTVLNLGDPVVLGIILGALFLLLLLFMVFFALRAAGRAEASAKVLPQQISQIGEGLRILGENQQQLSGGLRQVTEAQTASQQNVTDTLSAQQLKMSEVLAQSQMRLQENMTDMQLKTNRALSDLHVKMNETLSGSAKTTASSLGALHERLETIDKAQSNIEKLSGDVLSLQDILSNKQTRGAFGEIQLTDIVSKALPPDSYALQATLSNGRRADCLIHLPNPPGPIAIDSKFPLEPYEALRSADNDKDARTAATALRTAVRQHLADIAERYIIEGETADGALMFLPSEAVYAELHANFADVVREGFAMRVWTVSPTTCMATLNTMRAILKDARMREQAGAIRKELGLLFKDVERLETRVSNLDKHFGQAAKDIEEIKISASKAGNRARRLDSFDFEQLDSADAEVIKLPTDEAR